MSAFSLSGLFCLILSSQHPFFHEVEGIILFLLFSFLFFKKLIINLGFSS